MHIKQQFYIIISLLLCSQQLSLPQINMQSVVGGNGRNASSSSSFYPPFLQLVSLSLNHTHSPLSSPAPSPSPSPPPPSSSALLLEVIEKIGGVALVPDLLPAIIFNSTRTVNSASISLNSTLNTVVDSAPITTTYFIYVENPSQMIDPWRLNGGHLLTILLTHAFTCLVGVTGNVVVIANWWAAGTRDNCRRGRGGDGGGRRRGGGHGQSPPMAANHRLQRQQHRQLPRPTTAFLTSLAVADLLLLTVFMPLETAEYLVVTWDRQGHVCRLSAFVELLSAAASVLNLLAVSMERLLSSFALSNVYTTKD